MISRRIPLDEPKYSPLIISNRKTSIFFAVKTLDQDSNISAISNIVTEPTGNVPHVEILTPANGDSIGDAVTITAAASDDKGIAYVEFYVNGASIGIDAAPPYTETWFVYQLPHGSVVVFYAQAYDTDNNMTGSHTVECIIDSALYLPNPSAIVDVSDITDSSVSLVWTKNIDPDFDRYSIVYDTIQFDENDTVSTSAFFNQSTDTMATISGLLDTVIYHFAIKTEDQFGYTKIGEQIEVTTKNAPPDPIIFGVPYFLSDLVALAWTESPAHDFAAYKIYRSLDETITESDVLLATITQHDSLLFLDTTVVTGEEYYYGLIIEDASGLQTICGPIHVSLAYVNYALDFDGSDSYCTVPYYSGLDFTDQFTIEAWVYPRSNSNYCRIVEKTEAQCCLQYSLLLHGGKVGADMGIQQETGWYRRNGDDSVPLNTWSHIAVTYNSGQLCFYINSVLDKCITIPLTSLTQFSTGLNFGRRQQYNEFYFNGLIDEIRMWNNCRTQGEIASDYNSLLTGSETGLVGYWRFDEGQGQAGFGIVGSSCQLGSTAGTDSNDPDWVVSTVPISK